MSSTLLTVGTRISPLALWQTEYVIDLLQKTDSRVSCEKRTFVTQGDKRIDKPLAEIGGKGLFTLELENALRAGDIDIAVHSLKDLPVQQPDGITVGAILGRADVRDIFISANGESIDSIAPGSTIGTSSPRRKAQLLALRSDLVVEPIRGNVETRIRKVRENNYDGSVLAAAGVTRLGLQSEITQWLPLDIMLPAPGQGALAVQCRDDDSETLAYLATIDNESVRMAVNAERAFLDALGGGCAAPIAALGSVDGDQLSLQGLVAATDGTFVIRDRLDGPRDKPDELGRRLAENALRQGADKILSDG